MPLVIIESFKINDFMNYFAEISVWEFLARILLCMIDWHVIQRSMKEGNSDEVSKVSLREP
jgi:hypothetical protein